MPKVAPVPIGQNGSLIAGLSERSRSLEARRGIEGISIDPVPEVTALVGTAGVVAVMVGNATGVIMDGTTSYGLVILSASAAGNGGSTVYGLAITGLTPGWHSFAMDRSTYLGSGTPFLTVWSV